SPQQRELERVYVALRTTQGERVSQSDLAVVEPWVAAGWGTIVESRLFLTPLGWLRLDALVTALTEHRSR
ncbi:MAG: hypothetical protein ABIT38_24340, partial [Gemmatimonadaceae bacterium]